MTLLRSGPEDLQRQSAALAAVQAAGLRPGELALSLGRHFSLRDLIKWCRRMQVRVHRNAMRSQNLTSAYRARFGRKCHVCSESTLRQIASTATYVWSALLGLLEAWKCLIHAMQSPFDTRQRVQDMHGPLLGSSVREGMSAAQLAVPVRQAAFVEAADCFAAMLPDPQARRRDVNAAGHAPVGSLHTTPAPVPVHGSSHRFALLPYTRLPQTLNDV